MAAEISLRGYAEKSPVVTRTGKGVWPERYIDEPCQQFQILDIKYQDKERERITLPKNVQELLSHHKYSVLAHDASLYRKIGRDVSGMGGRNDFSGYAKVVTEQFRKPPPIGNLKNALQHMWGHVSDYPSNENVKIESWSLSRLLKEIQRRALESDAPYLTTSTALSELMVWTPNTWGRAYSCLDGGSVVPTTR